MNVYQNVIYGFCRRKNLWVTLSTYRHLIKQPVLRLVLFLDNCKVRLQWLTLYQFTTHEKNSKTQEICHCRSFLRCVYRKSRNEAVQWHISWVLEFFSWVLANAAYGQGRGDQEVIPSSVVFDNRVV